MIAQRERQLADFRALGAEGLRLFSKRELVRRRAELAAAVHPERHGRRESGRITAEYRQPPATA